MDHKQKKFSKCFTIWKHMCMRLIILGHRHNFDPLQLNYVKPLEQIFYERVCVIEWVCQCETYDLDSKTWKYNSKYFTHHLIVLKCAIDSLFWKIKI